LLYNKSTVANRSNGVLTVLYDVALSLPYSEFSVTDKILIVHYVYSLAQFAQAYRPPRSRLFQQQMFDARNGPVPSRRQHSSIIHRIFTRLL